jgi:hypothetical protein
VSGRGHAEPADYVVGRVKDALARHPISELGVTVTVVVAGAGAGAGDSDIFLDGTVLTEERRAAITDAVQKAAPGYDVHNEVTVLTLNEPDGVEQLS